MAKLEISKDFSSSKEKLYTAWTDPDQLKAWWKPLGKELLAVENNIETGGNVSYRFAEDELLIDGTYSNVEGKDLLEYSWNWHVNTAPVKDSAYTLSVRFAGDESKSSIAITQDGFDNEESIHPHRQGWEQSLEQLKAYLENGNQTSSDLPDPSAKVAGYREDPEQVKVGYK